MSFAQQLSLESQRRLFMQVVARNTLANQSTNWTEKLLPWLSSSSQVYDKIGIRVCD